MYMTILHMSDPNIHVFVTSHMMEGGAQKSITRMSATARFTMKMLVTDCIERVELTAMITCYKEGKSNSRGYIFYYIATCVSGSPIFPSPPNDISQPFRTLSIDRVRSTHYYSKVQVVAT